MALLTPQDNSSAGTGSDKVRRLGPRVPAPTNPVGPIVGDLWYDTSVLALKAWNGTAWVGVASGSSPILDAGVELYQSGSAPYIDFHRAANPAGDGFADYNIRMVNDASERLRIFSSAGTQWGSLWVASAKMGSYGWDPAWAHFGNHDSMDASSISYCLMHHTNGDTLLNSTQSVRLRYNGGDKTWIQWDGQHNNDWVRCDTHGIGVYFAPGDGGWKMFNGDGTIYSHNDKDIYTGNHVRAGDAYIRTWGGGGGHSICSCWGASNTKGWLTRNDGNMWVMMETQMFIRGNDGGDYFNFYRFGDVRLNVPTVAPGDPDLRIAGSHQLLRNASNRSLKKNIVPLDSDTNPIWDIPTVRYHWKDDAREHGYRFNERNPQGYPGFIAEDLYEVAPDACTVDSLSGEPNGPDNWALLAYVVEGLQQLKTRIDELEKK